MWNKENPPVLLVGLQSYIATIAITIKLRKMGIYVPPDPVLTLLNISLNDTLYYHKDTCSNLFTAALFTVFTVTT